MSAGGQRITVMHFVAIGSPAEDTVGELIVGKRSRQTPECK
jgi:hypothetical protein